MKPVSLLQIILLAIPLLASAFTAEKPAFPHPKNTRKLTGSFNAASPNSSSHTNLLDPFFQFFPKKNEKISVLSPNKDVTVIDPDYKLAWIFGAAALAIALGYPDKSCLESDVMFCPPTFVPGFLAFLHLWFGVFLADRAARIRCVFTKEHFQMMNAYSDDTLKSTRELAQRDKNYVVGGLNKWKYNDFVNFEFFPSVHLPVLVYFKETGTPKGKWNVGPGKWDSQNNGMVHFFPAFGNSYQLQKEFTKRGCKNVE
jgi:hypothetical protein